jgi:hypothetical protein
MIKLRLFLVYTAETSSSLTHKPSKAPAYSSRHVLYTEPCCSLAPVRDGILFGLHPEAKFMNIQFCWGLLRHNLELSTMYMQCLLYKSVSNHLEMTWWIERRKTLKTFCPSQLRPRICPLVSLRSTLDIKNLCWLQLCNTGCRKRLKENPTIGHFIAFNTPRPPFQSHVS